ncbi:MAG: trigger factor [Myxococcota bacterium]|jgi:trigger factor|nr:trigger factor [bacterium]MDP6075393.1 trigger factor [Myxococcota bacterium]MDP6244135.1 trigger factor [Myxococcota bacterium]MDP7076416.1 trigger factor [Myxococcota bacterium]MDP7298003.1 trigger factor [Myxococcota bacterium]
MTDENASPEIRVDAQAETPVLHRLEVEVDASRVKRAFDRAYRDLARQARVKGFRPGKAPRSVLEKLYGGSVAEQIEQTLVSETLVQAVEQAGLEAVAEPAIEAGAPEPDTTFRYTARIEVKPAIELPELSDLPGRRPRVEVGDADVERELEGLRDSQAQLIEEPEATPLVDAHVAVIDFVGRVEGEPFEGGSGQGVELTVGAGQFLPGFEEQLRGACSGDDREVTITFPEDYGNEGLAGKEAVFAVHVAAVKRREVPVLGDAFAKDLGDFDSLDALRERIRSDLTGVREREARTAVQRSILDALGERVSFELPPGMIEQQLQQRLESAHRRLGGQVPHEALHEQIGRWREEWRGEAERDVRDALLLEAVADAEALEVADAAVEARLQELAGQQGVAPERLRTALGGESFEPALRRQLRDEQALEFLVAQAKIEETTDT